MAKIENKRSDNIILRVIFDHPDLCEEKTHGRGWAIRYFPSDRPVMANYKPWTPNDPQ
jgi:hypothetical protein